VDLCTTPPHVERPILLRGEPDLACWDSEPDRLIGLMNLDGRCYCYTLDLTGVTFIDCSGARMLLALDDRVRGVGGVLNIGAASVVAVRLLQLLATCGYPAHLVPGPATADAPDPAWDRRALCD
jgi:hypothetical protein